MSRVSSLAIAGRSPVAKFHDLRLKYWNRDLDVVCCFEGSDDVEFYMPHIRDGLGLHPERIDFINCGGKSVVLTLWDWAGQRGWNWNRLAFFVDRDLDDFLSVNPARPHLYVTDHYSIESHVLDEGFFHNVWQDLFRLATTDVRRSVWKDSYETGIEKFARILKPIIYVAVATKRAGGKVDFDRVPLGDFFGISNSGSVLPRKNKGAVEYSKIFSAPYPSRASVRQARSELNVCDTKSWLRGKFAISFAMTFFSRMKTYLGSKQEPNRAVVKASFGMESAIACLCKQAPVPASLIAFVAHWAQAIVRDGLDPYGAAA